MSNRMEVNERIKSSRVRVIDENGNQKGIMFIRDAIAYARNLDLDLLKIADANPPVCKVVDAGKYIYEQQKAQKEMARKQRANAVQIKEVQLRPGTDVNDVKIKARKAKGFLEDGDKVKVVVRFRGRENAHKQIGHDVIRQFMEELGEHKVEKVPTEAGNEISAIFAPLKKQ